MAGIWGADVEQLRALAYDFDGGGDRIAVIRGHLDQLFGSTAWQGPDADECAGWWSHFGPQLDAAARALTESAVTLRANADAQDAASNDLGASGGPAPTAVPASFAGASPTPSPSPGPAPVPVEDDGVDHGSREDQRREGRRDVGSGGGGPGDPEYGTDGPDHYPSGLGPGVPGTDVPRPEARWWTPIDRGSDEFGPSWNTEDASFADQMKEWAVGQAADFVSPAWPDAARNLQHYLGNSGEPLDQPVDTMLADLPGFESGVVKAENTLARDAVAAAKAQGATGPVTFPVRTDWSNYGATPAESDNWFYATGSFQYGLTGQVTVYPPTSPGGEWRYETETVVNTRDRYNWDGTKATQIGPLTVTDAELQEFHRKGLAREYTLVGESSARTGEGSVP